MRPTCGFHQSGGRRKKKSTGGSRQGRKFSTPCVMFNATVFVYCITKVFLPLPFCFNCICDRRYKFDLFPSLTERECGQVSMAFSDKWYAVCMNKRPVSVLILVEGVVSLLNTSVSGPAYYSF
jgi:hypothetical protein